MDNNVNVCAADVLHSGGLKDKEATAENSLTFNLELMHYWKESFYVLYCFTCLIQTHGILSGVDCLALIVHLSGSQSAGHNIQ